MLEWAKQPCRLLVYISYPSQGKVPMFSVSRTWLWEIAEPILHYQNCFTDAQGKPIGSKKLVGFTLKVRCGHWAEYFLNEERRRNELGYYECGILSKQILHNLMGMWHHQEGAARLMTWLLFKTRVNQSSPITVETLMKVAFGEAALQAARTDSQERRSIVRKWICVLRSLLSKDWQITPDAKTYPMQYWVETPATKELEQIPDDPEDAIAFWTDDANAPKDKQLTHAKRRVRGSFEHLLTGRLWIDPPSNIMHKLAPAPKVDRPSSSKSRKSADSSKPSTSQIIQSGKQLKQFRIAKGWNQAELAEQIDRSLSWVKMVESGKRQIQSIDQSKLLNEKHPQA
jgi:Helix-turn-helix domain